MIPFTVYMNAPVFASVNVNFALPTLSAVVPPGLPSGGNGTLTQTKNITRELFHPPAGTVCGAG